jgi:hypothetical protein
VEMNICLDANVARLVHMDWVLELERIIQENGSKKESKVERSTVGAPGHTIGHEDCELGCWLYGRACQQYSDSHQVWPLSDVHQKFHRVSDELLEVFWQGNQREVSRLLAEVHQLSREIIYLLTCIELDILERDKHPIYSAYSTVKGLLNKKILIGNNHSVATFRSNEVVGPVVGQFKGVGNGMVEDTPEKVEQIKKLNASRLAHIRWVNGLRNTFINFRDTELLPVEQCDLGMWIHHDDHRFLDGHEHLEDLDIVHKEFHHYASKTVSAMRDDRYQGYEGFYFKSLALSKEIIFLLTRMEYDFEGGDNIAARMGSVDAPIQASDEHFATP